MLILICEPIWKFLCKNKDLIILLMAEETHSRLESHKKYHTEKQCSNIKETSLTKLKGN